MAKKKVAKSTTKSSAKATTTKGAKKKKATRKKKSVADVRKRLLWAVFSSSMKEEGRYPYDQRKEAEKKLEQLSQKSKKAYFILPVKEVVAEAPKKKVKEASSEEE